MKPSILARFTGLTLAGIVGVHLVVWAMEIMLSEPGEQPMLSRDVWWTSASLQLSALVQVRVGLLAILVAAVLRSFRSSRWFQMAVMSAAVVLEIMAQSTGLFGATRAEVITQLGSFAHTGLTIGAAQCASLWIEHLSPGGPTIAAPAFRQAR